MSTVPNRSRGRPAQLSRERILETTLTLLQTVPTAELTMQRLARELGTTPTALYGYFGSQRELFHCAGELVLAGVDLDAARRAKDWREALRAWAHAVRVRTLQYRYASDIGQYQPHIPVASFAASAVLAKALREAGLGDQLLMDCVRWINRTVFGAIRNEVTLDPYNLTVESAEAAAALAHLPAEARAEIERLAPYLGDQDNDALFSFTVERLVDGVAALLRPAAPPS
jgi:AcrR family transcriptional regulator